MAVRLNKLRIVLLLVVEMVVLRPRMGVCVGLEGERVEEPGLVGHHVHRLVVRAIAWPLLSLGAVGGPEHLVVPKLHTYQRVTLTCEVTGGEVT